MTVHPADNTEVLYCATIVVMSAVNKLDALAIVALAADSLVEGQLTQRPWIPLPDDGTAEHGSSIAWVEIEIPKFGEPPPLAIDVYSSLSDQHAKLTALTLIATLESNTAWKARPDFEV
jgi:hypothetical protein